MIRICVICKKILGEKEPFEDKSETHGYCDPCLKIELEKLKIFMTERRIKGETYGPTTK